MKFRGVSRLRSMAAGIGAIDLSRGLPLIMTKPFFLRAEHCCGNVSEAPDSAVEKSPSSMMDCFTPT
ncbi:hypothetical protein EYF80_018345 [Liparis tanakae]|uniref:Uncharacterized protein n=1 Tax=Liparis tanakae TaxID=230148 RepID=A0A4Z2I036_9TELE|nr:hypothetical protein EYF80_018345 [Liparis tanakae]